MQNQVKIWDPLVRIFHWSLVLFFVLAYITGEDESSLHSQAGYVVLGLIIFRIIWGLIGPKYARFSQFMYGPATVKRYIKGMMRGDPEHYAGHNPLGGWMVIALLAMLFVVTLSGLKLYAVEEGKGPFAANTNIEIISSAKADSDRYEHDDDEKEYEKDAHDDAGEEFWEDIHEASSELLVLLIFMHIAGVIAASFMHDENLVRAMITGKKRSQDS